MPVVKIEPTDQHPVPYSLDDETPKTLVEEIAVAGNTAELQVELGASLELPTDADQRKLKALISEASKRKNPDKSALSQTNTAYAAAAFLRQYGQHLAFDAAQARAAITSKLMEIANCGEIKHELRALELLGKHSDIGLFTDRTEININYNSPESLEKAIKERVKRLLNADIIDVTPVGQDLDEELGIFDDVDGTVTLASEMEAMLGPDEPEEGDETDPDA